jgi:hypothetical protein
MRTTESPDTAVAADPDNAAPITVDVDTDLDAGTEADADADAEAGADEEVDSHVLELDPAAPDDVAASVPDEAAEPTIAIEPAATAPVRLDPAPAPASAPANSELAVLRNELTSALHEAHFQRRKRADAVQLLVYERLVRRSRVAGCLWLVLAIALAAGGVWALLQSTELADAWQIGAASAGALALICLVVAIVTWAGPARAQQSLSLRQVRKLAPPEMLSEAWFQVAHEVTSPLGYRKAFHGLV